MRSCLIILFSQLVLSAGAMHPVHISVINFDINCETSEISYSVRLFPDDFAAVINARYGAQVYFSDKVELNKNQMIVIEKYLNEHFITTINNNKIVPELESWKMIDDAVMFYLRATFDKNCTDFEFENTIMTEIFPDQKNLLIFAYENSEKGFTFNTNITKQRFKLSDI